MDREPGFYWTVSPDGTGDSTIAEWDGLCWSLIGSEVPFREDEVKAITERLNPPPRLGTPIDLQEDIAAQDLD